MRSERAAILIWGLVVGAGLSSLAIYTASPGGPGDPALRWPSGTGLRTSPGRATAILFVRPECPCSRASLAEFASALARCEHPPTAFVVVPGPGPSPGGDDWIGDRVARMPGVKRRPDPSGAEAARFGVVTSGHALVFDASGVLAFSGGITSGRGHEGKNAGALALVDRADGRASGLASAPIFGCLIGPIDSDAALEEGTR